MSTYSPQKLEYLPLELEDNYLHYEFDVGQNDTVQVTLDKSANVKLLDDANYRKYRAGQQYRYHGGFVKVSSAMKESSIDLTVPHERHWHLIIDLGGYPGIVHASGAIARG